VIDRPLRLLVVSSPPPLKRLPELYLGLLESGVELVFAAAPDDVPEAIRAAGAHTVELPLRRGDEDAAAVQLLRAGADLVRYLGPELAGARWPRMRATRRLLKLARYPKANRISREAANFRLPDPVQAGLRRVFRELERELPPPADLETAMAGLAADGVVLVSRFLLGGPEPDVVKAARRLGLPSLMLVWSWDNLSSKAVLNEHPDRLLVWNDFQAGEAEQLHGIAPERVRVVGAANFDRFFEELAAAGPAAGDGRRTVLYLGSSPKVAPGEPAIFDRWLRAVRGSGDPLVGDARIVLRPHPAASESWARWAAPADVEVTLPQAKIEQAELARLLTSADAVVALNTSAEIEAAVAGVPVLTFRAGPDARGQEGSVHFTYLLEQYGGFVVDSSGLDEHVADLARVLAGDHDPEPARRFVERFVRPAGVDAPVTPLVAAAIVEETRAARSGPTRRPSARAPAPGRSTPRILVLSPHGLVRSVPDVFLELLAGGAELVFSGRRADRLRLPGEITAHPRTEVVSLPLVADGEPRAIDVLRAFRDAARFRDPGLEDAAWPRKRATRRLLKLIRHPDWKQALADLEPLQLPPGVWAYLDAALAELELLMPARAELVRAIAAQRPDAMLVVTRCTLDTYEPDVLKAARALDIPVSMLVWSWDNLSSKATLHERPDRLIVWNEVQAAEAVELHGIPREHVVAAGAANFDRFFAEVEEAGDARGDRPTIVYLGSSTNVAPAEPEIFERWLAAVRGSDDPAVRDAHVLVRPHPAGKAWLDWSPSDPGVYLEQPRKDDSGGLAALLARAHAVVALNTSAELEAAIARRPVLTFRAGDAAPGQEGSHHFRYLLEAEGGVVQDAAGLAEHVAKLAGAVRGDHDVARIDRFVELFVRPGGLDSPVAPVVASAVLALAAHREPAGV
jgi:hypothetical protein